MPAKLERCVNEFMDDAANKKKWPDAKKRRNAAYAICNASIKSDEGDYSYAVSLSETALAEDNTAWIQVLPLGTFQHEVWGPINITQEKIDGFISNFEANVKGQDLPLDYEHRRDVAKGGKAAGWFREVKSDNGLWAKVEFTPTAAEEVKNDEWRYISAEYHDEWCDGKAPQETCYVDVLAGAALTNIPWMKNMAPINFSEVVDDPTIMAELASGELFGDPDVAENGKFTQEEARYRAATASTRRCANCAYFRDGGCLVVDGEIDPNYISDYFVALESSHPSDLYWTDGKLAIELIEGRGEEGELPKLREVLGLSEDATDEAVASKITELVEFEKTAKAAAAVEDRKRKFAEDYPDEAKQMADDRRALAESKASAQIEAWNREGLPPALNPLLSGLLLGEATVKLSEGDKEVEVPVSFNDIVTRLLKIKPVPLKASGANNDPGSETFDDPREEMESKTKALMEEKKLSYREARKLVAAENPDLALSVLEAAPKAQSE